MSTYIKLFIFIQNKNKTDNKFEIHQMAAWLLSKHVDIYKFNICINI